ncbi:MAG TPA: phosphotransferase, partial [Acidimicrobiales bacterium]|nr:phosphotransferase [Acidimicrobiales bacterium]
SVVGVVLQDGRQMVVKVRAPAARLAACFEVQRVLFERGFPCPEPVVAPCPLGPWTASAEVFVPDGSVLPGSGRQARPFAEALARLLVAAPRVEQIGSLRPAPPWTAWDHPGPGLWPWPDDRDLDLNQISGPEWLDNAATLVRDRLARSGAEPVVGHGDWYAGNLRWAGVDLLSVHDWDSVIAAPETVVVGLAGAVYPVTGDPGGWATVEESEDFLACYEAAANRPFTESERQDAWAAGLWSRAFDAKKQFASDGLIDALGEEECLRRLDMAGIS